MQIDELLLIFGVPAMVVIIMHQFEIFGHRVYSILVSRALNFKPFNCELCMSFWTYFLLHGFLFQFDFYNILGAFICALLGYIYSFKFIKF